MARLPKIMVRIKTPVGEYFCVRRVLPDGLSVLIEKESKRKNRDAWKVSFTRKSLYPVKRYGMKKMMCIDVVKDSPKAIEYQYTPKDPVNIPLYDRATERERTTAKILSEWGEGPSFKPSPLTYIILAFSLIGMLGTLYMIYRLVA